MIRAYNELYLSDARTVLANSIDYAIHTLGCSLEEYYHFFIQSDIAAYIENGDPFFVSGKSGIEIALLVLEKKYGKYDYKERLYQRGKSKEYWVGWVMAYYQWYSALSFMQIDHTIPIKSVFAMYDKYHEMDISHFVDYLNELRLSSRAVSYLKVLREKQGYSQSELSKITGIPLKTLQHYEQGDKKLSNANVNYILRLSKALSCSPESLAL